MGAGRRAYISGLEGLGDVGKASAWKEIALDVGDGQALDGEQVTLHTVDGRGTIDQHDLCCKSQNKKTQSLHIERVQSLIQPFYALIQPFYAAPGQQ